MLRKKAVDVLSKIGPAVKRGAGQAAKGQSGLFPAAFAKNGRDTQAVKKRS